MPDTMQSETEQQIYRAARKVLGDEVTLASQLEEQMYNALDAAGVGSGGGGGSSPLPADTLPLVAGEAAIGTSTRYARQDHVHPAQTFSGYVDTTSDQTISGIKSFTAGATITNAADLSASPMLTFTNGNLTKGTPPETAQFALQVAATDVAGKDVGAIRVGVGTSGNVTTGIYAYRDQADATDNVHITITCNKDTGKGTAVSPQLSPDEDNTRNLGGANKRWAVVYAGTGSINTSDERCKADITDIPEAVLRAWGKVQFQQFKMLDAVEQKGQMARLHIGVIAQRIDEAFKSEGLDARDYGLFCFDSWDAAPTEFFADGSVAVEGVEAGERYSVRYDECLALECAYQRWQLSLLRAELAGK